MTVTLPKVDPQIETDIVDVSGVDAIGDWKLLEAIVLAESSGNPKAVNPGGYYGLLQLSPDYGKGMPSSYFAGTPVQPGGTGYQGPYTPGQLEDPVTNLFIGASPIAAAVKEGRKNGLTGAALVNYAALHSGHDSWTGEPTGANPQLIPTIDAYYQALQARTDTPGQSGPGNIPVVGGPINAVAGAVENVANTVKAASNFLSDPAGAVGQVGDALSTWIKGNGWKIILAIVALVIVFGAGRKLLAGVGA